MALDESHLAVHWHPGRFTNGPVEGYRLRLRADSGNLREQVGLDLMSFGELLECRFPFLLFS